MERCATGEHRGATLLELAATTQAGIQQAISEGMPGYEHFVAVQHSARRLWPHPCRDTEYGLGRACWREFSTAGARHARCQKWFHFAAAVRDLPTEVRNAELAEYERELYPELCA